VGDTKTIQLFFISPNAFSVMRSVCLRVFLCLEGVGL